jgi:acyl-CoA thioester hydrolase
MELHFEYATKIRVRYGETDQMGYCYYGNYAQYFEVGRLETLRALGMSYKSLEEQGIMLPVSKYEVEFRSPAFYDDEIEIKTTIEEIQGPRISFCYEASRNQDLLARGKTVLVFVKKENMRPTKPPKAFLDIIDNFKVKPK